MAENIGWQYTLRKEELCTFLQDHSLPNSPEAAVSDLWQIAVAFWRNRPHEGSFVDGISGESWDYIYYFHRPEEDLMEFVKSIITHLRALGLDIPEMELVNIILENIASHVRAACSIAELRALAVEIEGRLSAAYEYRSIFPR
ncbi:hypothetical protein PR048_011525 [Dryococelus australis]|uniref:Uncharacterized protein n=1 Tax=Dryococelus australis TaxID=614101 RepID=A0ABQ9HLV2_9NEOP|nr:hypothetical protein PR048_011525 [Dryococelus australis]